MNNTVFIGGGNMAYAILGGLLKTGQSPAAFRVIDPSPLAAEKIGTLGVQCSPNWPEGFTPTQIVLAVKPQSMQSVLEHHAPHFTSTLLISIAAGISVAQLRQWSQQPQARVVRCMPNTPALVGQGISGLYFTDNCHVSDKTSANTLFQSCGEVLTVNTESDINAITAISGSGPGYVFFLMDALAKAAKQLGFTETQANMLVKQTFLGSASLACASNDSFATLQDKVTSKGGTTFAGLEQLRTHNVEHAIAQAAQAALQRANELQSAGQ